jgi:lipopolysaccharide/colanic/teichoic acid biosynthesis glycosyltransferase
VNPFRRSPSVESLNGIPSPEEFSRILERERERSDRTGQGFSLVVFEYGENNPDIDAMRTLRDCILSRKVRAIDEVGWFKEGSIATLLACTSPDGAQKFANDVVNGIPAGIEAPICRVFTYPSTRIFKGNGEGEEREDIDDETIRPKDSRAGIRSISESSRIESEKIEKIMGRPIPLWKRFLDIFGAVVGLILFSPLFLLIAILIKIVSPGPVFFRQERIGYLGRPFMFWKFRTMHVNNDDTGHKQYSSHFINENVPMRKLDDLGDSRIIPFGKILRTACLDELPQLINVLMGEMSLVGPRPCIRYEAEEYLQWHARRFDIVPGMTGLWQVSGKSRLTFKEMIRLDIRYSRKMSLGLDLKIILLTVPAILGMVLKSHSAKAASKRKTVKLTEMHVDMPSRLHFSRAASNRKTVKLTEMHVDMPSRLHFSRAVSKQKTAKLPELHVDMPFQG